MKQWILLSLLFVTMQAAAQGPGWRWAVSASGRQHDQANAVVADRWGNVYVAGYFTSDSIIFGMQILYNHTPGFNDMFVAKFDSMGNHQWTRAAGGNNDDKAHAVGVDSSGNVYVAGSFYSSNVIFGSDTLTNAGFVGDIFIVKYDGAGNILTAWREGGPSVEIPYALHVEPGGGLVVAGRFSSLSITFGTTTLTQAGSMDIFVVKYDAAGNVLWANGAGGGSNDEAYDVDEDAAGNVYVAGYFNSNISFGTVPLTSAGSADAFLAKYSGSGSLVWAKRAGGNGDDRTLALFVDDAGNSFVAGFYQSASATFGSLTLNSFVATGNDNAFIAQYDSAGTPQWAKGLNGRSRAQGITVSDGDVLACGVFRDSTMFAGFTITCDGSTDLFVVSLYGNGTAEWLTKNTSGGSGSEFATAIATAGLGKVVIAGYFNSSPIEFYPYTLNNTQSGFDFFAALMATTTVGTFDLEERNLQVYPNPATDHIMIRLQPGVWELNLYDVNGKLVFSKDGCAGKIEVSLRDFTKGIYLLKARKGELEITEAIVVN